jgi:multidrug efflux system membrane fusion protein
MAENLPSPTAAPRPLRKRLAWLAGALVVFGGAAAGYFLYYGPGAATPAPAAGAQAPAGGPPGAGGPPFGPPGAGGTGPGGRRGAPGAGGPLPVTAAAARAGDIDVILTALGTVVAQGTATVRNRVDGLLQEARFREGDTVKAGTVLALIDPRSFEVALAQSMGQLAKDQAQLRNAQLDLERYRTLLAQDSIASQQVDTQESLVRQMEGTVLADQAQVDSAKLQLSYTKVTAPIGGRLGLRLVDPGNMVKASDANGLVVITQVQPITVTFSIPQDNLPPVLGRISSGDRLVVEAWNRDGKRKIATGQLLTVDNQIDTTTGTVKLKAAFRNDDMALFPNQFVNVRMRLDTLTGVTLIPAAALQRGSPGTFVYLVKEDNSVTLRPVKPGVAEGEAIAIESGLVPGDKVVVDGGDKLREGAKVEVIVRDSPATGGARKGPPGERKGRGEARKGAKDGK